MEVPARLRGPQTTAVGGGPERPYPTRTQAFDDPQAPLSSHLAPLRPRRRSLPRHVGPAAAAELPGQRVPPGGLQIPDALAPRRGST